MSLVALGIINDDGLLLLSQTADHGQFQIPTSDVATRLEDIDVVRHVCTATGIMLNLESATVAQLEDYNFRGEIYQPYMVHVHHKGPAFITPLIRTQWVEGIQMYNLHERDRLLAGMFKQESRRVGAR